MEAIKIAVRRKVLKEHFHAPLPALLYVALQQGWWERTMKVGFEKEGPWGPLWMETSQRRPSWLRIPSMHCALPKWGFLVRSAGIPCKDVQSSHAV